MKGPDFFYQAFLLALRNSRYFTNSAYLSEKSDVFRRSTRHGALAMGATDPDPITLFMCESRPITTRNRIRATRHGIREVPCARTFY